MGCTGYRSRRCVSRRKSSPLWHARLELPELTAAALVDSVRGALTNKTCLIVLDNCEHVLEEVAEVVASLRAVPGPCFLATSRERLNLQAEQLYPVGPLSLHDAVELFNDRARYTNPFHESDDAVGRLCEALDSLPLALELAAAQTDVHSPSELLASVSTALESYKGTRDQDPRHRTLRATVDWGYERLGEEERRVYRSLSTMAGGCSLAAAEAVCNARSETIHYLLSKSFIRTGDVVTGRRFLMLETIRLHAYEKLAEYGEEASVLARHGDYFAEAAAGADALVDEVGIAGAIERLEPDTGNIRASLTYARDATPELALRACIGLRGSMVGLGLLRAVVDTSRQAIANAVDLPADLLAQALTTSGTAAYTIGEFELATPQLERAIEILRELDDSKQLARALNNQGVNHYHQADWPRARLYFIESLELLREMGDDLAEAAVLNLAALSLNEGDYKTASRFAHEVHERSENKSEEQLHALVILTLVALAEGDEGALPLSREALDVATALGALESSDARWIAARCCIEARDFKSASELLGDSLQYYAATDEAQFVNEPLLACATFASRMNDHEAALRLLGAAEALGEGLGAHYDDLWASELRGDAERSMSAADVSGMVMEGHGIARAVAIQTAQRVLIELPDQ